MFSKKLLLQERYENAVPFLIVHAYIGLHFPLHHRFQRKTTLFFSRGAFSCWAKRQAIRLYSQCLFRRKPEIGKETQKVRSTFQLRLETLETYLRSPKQHLKPLLIRPLKSVPSPEGITKFKRAPDLLDRLWKDGNSVIALIVFNVISSFQRQIGKTLGHRSINDGPPSHGDGRRIFGLGSVPLVDKSRSLQRAHGK